MSDSKNVVCVYCTAKITVALPCVCPSCGLNLTKPVNEMLASELFLAARMNGLVLILKWVPMAPDGTSAEP